MVLLGGLIIPISLWVIYAKSMDIPVTPDKAHVNLALSYFAEEGIDRRLGEARYPLEEKFKGKSTWDVVTYDPIHIAKTYTKDMYHNLHRVVFTWDRMYPFTLLSIAGCVVLVLYKSQTVIYLYLLLTIAQFLLINFKSYFEGRYYLFLLPWIGATIGLLIWFIHKKAERFVPAKLVLTCFVFLSTILIGQHLIAIDKKFHSTDAELDFAISSLSQVVKESDAIMARKDNVAFYSGIKSLRMIDRDATMEDLRQKLSELSNTDGDGDGNIYLYLGSIEKALRPQFQPLMEGESNPAWLELIARFDEHGWSIYKYVGVE